MQKKASSPSSKKEFYKCPHCMLVVDFPVDYCTICKGHTHVMNMGNPGKPPGICQHCFEGGSDQGRQWRRNQGTWAPNPFFRSSWDDPEWYDMDAEWRNSTLDLVWQEDDNNIAEF